jgi:chromosome partitioning protein
MRSLAIVARKGGAGKSTMAIHLAIGGHLRERFTLLADMDPQASSVEALGHRKGSGSLVRATTARKLFVCLEDARKAGIEDLVIDTAAGSDAERLEAIRLADASLIVVRPTYLDIVAAAPTVLAVRGLGKPAMILLNQAPPTLKGEERPDNARAIAALALFGLPVSSAIIRLRRSYQRAPQLGVSVEESFDDEAAAEMASACDTIWAFRQAAGSSLSPGRIRYPQPTDIQAGTLAERLVRT